ncbi:hypothetical protein, partial [Pseudomonas syringae]|uniref:hypothetical protein n=1 Tax=Pseudomonas syringae TaxID=317 RepID=UPI001C7E1F70
PTRPTISKIWKAHENADFQVFFCVADCHARIATLGFRHGVDAAICEAVGRSFEEDRSNVAYPDTQSLIATHAPASGDVNCHF